MHEGVEEIKVREYRCEDCKEIVKLFYDSVHCVNSTDYTESQLNAWATKEIDFVEWDNRLSNNYSVIAEKDGIIVGFGVVDDKGYFDLLYVHKDYQRMGIATLIADNIEGYVCDKTTLATKGSQSITVVASITAKPFFESRGYVVQEKQIVECRGQLFVNFKMQKTLQTNA